MTSADAGWSTAKQALNAPADYFEATVNVQAYVQYRVWVRLRALNNSKWNDAVWIQFADSLDADGNPASRIGSSGGLLFNLQSCDGCGLSNWGWARGAYWLSDGSYYVQFPTAGSRTIRVQTREDGVDVDQIVLSPSKYLTAPPGGETNDSTILPRSNGSGGTTTPTSSPAISVKTVPATIEAEDFDNGANGGAYSDRTSGNNGGQYRATDVDIEGCTEGGYNVGWIDAGEWLKYTVNVPSAGSYTLEFRVASPSGSRLHVEFGGTDETGTVTVPATGSWRTWTTVRSTVSLAAGSQVMRVVLDGGALNFNWVKVISGGTTSTPIGPRGGTPRAIPGTVQAEDFDEGGQNSAYYDNSNGNSGSAYRSTDVDIENRSGGGYNIGWVGAGEWLKYTVNVTTAGTYTLTARVASAGSGGTFRVEFGGQDKTGTLSVPNTGGWQTFQDVRATVSLAAGVQTMRVAFVANGSTGAIGNVDYVGFAAGSAPAPAPAPTPAPSTNGRLRVMTWNIHFGKSASNVLNVYGQAQQMAQSGADVILLQEASTWDGDQPNQFPVLLRQLTGQTWTAVWSAHYGTSGEGTLILTRLPVVSSSIRNFNNRGFSRVAVSVNGVTVNVFNTHLHWYDTSLRTSQLLGLMDWARGYSGPRIIGGDFNAWWGEYWIRQMETQYSDTWQDVTGSDENGYTLNNPPTVRFDFLFRAFDSNWRLTPLSCWVKISSLSDHQALLADYQVR